MLVAGTTQSPFEDTTGHTYIMSPWIDILKRFLHQDNATIITPHIRRPRLIRQNDQSIMSVACKHISNRATLILINNCRIWLQVTTLAEITNTNGTHIMACALTGAEDTHNNLTI
jgi:citrate lyase beta subunit